MSKLPISADERSADKCASVHHPQSSADTQSQAAPRASLERTIPEQGQDAPDWDDPSLSRATHVSAGSAAVLEKHRKKKRRHKGLKVALIVLGILLVLAVALVAAAEFLRAQGQQAMHVDYTEGQTLTHNGVTYRYNENVVTLCVIGYDRVDKAGVSPEEKPGQADAIAVLALDTETGKATGIVIPRESMVEVNTYAEGSFTGTTTEQLCLAFSYGNGTDTSAENVVTSVQRILNNMPINYYIAMSRDGIVPLNDAVGGITLTALEDVPGTNIQQGQEVTLLGDTAKAYVQQREFWGTQGSVDRMSRQAQYVRAFAQKALSLATSAGGIGTLTDLFGIMQNYATTNLGVGEFGYLASVLMDKGISDVNMVTLEGSMVQGESFAEFTLDTAYTYQVVLDTFYTPVETSGNNG